MNSKIKNKYKTPIIVLSIISIILIIAEYLYWFSQSVVSVQDVIFSILYLAATVLFLIYILKFHKNPKAAICLPIVFGLIVLPRIYIDVENLVMVSYARGLILDLLFIVVPFVLAAINALKGFSKKSLTIISFSVIFLGWINDNYYFIKYIKYYILEVNSLIDFCFNIGISIGTLLLYISLFLFALNNRIPAILTPFSEKTSKMSPEQILKIAKNKIYSVKNISEMPHEQALMVLKNKLDLGLISEEEYQAQRIDIISKL